MRSKYSTPTTPTTLVLAALVALGTTACGGPSTPTPAPEAATPATDTQAADAAAADKAAAEQAAAEQAAAEIAAREQELKAKEVELELRERELAAQQAAAAKAPAKASTPSKTASTTPKPATAAPAAAAPPPPPVTVPAGTDVSVKLNSDYSTKTTTLGAAVNAELASDLVVGGRRVAKAGAPISGTVTEVTSGSHKIGAVPALKIDFTQLVVADGTTLPVNIRIMQKGQSEKGRDTAKIVGGTAAGAIIGNQVNSGKGAVIGGVLGGAAGAIGAQKTGTEVELPAGSVLPAKVRTAFEYKGK